MVKPPSINEVLKVISKLEGELQKIEPQIKWLKSAMDKELSGLTAQVHTLTTALKSTTTGLEDVQRQLDGVAPKPVTPTPVAPPPMKIPAKPTEVVPPTVIDSEGDEDLALPASSTSVFVARLFSEVVRIAKAGASGNTIGKKLLEVRDLIQEKVSYSPVYHEMATFARLMNTYQENPPPEDNLEVLKRRTVNWQSRLKT
ncbi:MAG: hypothetical protein ACXACA_01715 [Candidatus Ranarchaeia archaeon]|jgi:hypothetical protein